MFTGAGSVEVSARPALPTLHSTSGKLFRISSCLLTSRRLLPRRGVSVAKVRPTLGPASAFCIHEQPLPFGSQTASVNASHSKCAGCFNAGPNFHVEGPMVERLFGCSACRLRREHRPQQDPAEVHARTCVADAGNPSVSFISTVSKIEAPGTAAPRRGAISPTSRVRAKAAPRR